MRVVKMYAWEQTIGSKLPMVQGMRVVKMYAWEQTIGSKLAEVRAKELRLGRKQRFLSMIIMQLLNLKVAVGRITKFLMNEELSDEIKARSLEVEASFKEARAQGSPPIALSTAMGEILSETPDTGVAMSSVLRNAADGAAVALDLVSSAFSANVESEESVRIRTKAAPAATMAALAEEGDITIEGTFGWKKIKAEADTESE